MNKQTEHFLKALQDIEQGKVVTLKEVTPTVSVSSEPFSLPTLKAKLSIK
jgi:hypothetical protein